ncbi:MAG TPA: hypothetical protein VGC90_06100 [Candidatus Limnocylindrales bacterium]
MAIPRFAAHRARSHRFAVTGLACLIVLGVAGCGDDKGSAGASAGAEAAATSGLVILAGEVGAATLTAYDAAGSPRPLAMPGTQTAWISAGRRGTLLSTASDGTLRVSNTVRTDRQPTWTRVAGPDEKPPADAPLYFAEWAPSGDRFAALATSFGDPTPHASLFLVNPIVATSLIIPIAAVPLPAPPSWVDDDRVAVVTTLGVTVVDTRTGDAAAVLTGPLSDAALVDVAADGSRVALVHHDGRAIEIRGRDEWLSCSGQPEATISAEGTIGAVTLDRRAERLAVAWDGGTGGPGTVVVFTRATGWREAARIRLEGNGSRAAVAWLP